MRSKIRDKSKISIIICLIALSLMIVVSIGFTFAFFTDKVTTPPQQLEFGKISITTNNDSSVTTDKWFGDRTYAQSLAGGSPTIQNDIKFNLADDSEPCYIRVKYGVELVSGADGEFEKAYKFLKYRNLTLSSGSDYSWSEKRGDYYYLLNSQNEPLKVSSKRASDYVFLTKENSILPSDLYFGKTTQTNKVKMNISIEALQVANIVKETGDATLIDTIERELNTLNYSSSNNPNQNTNKYSVTFHINNSAYSFDNISYAGSKDLSTNANVTAILDKELSLWNDGIGVLTNNGNNHSYIKNNKIYNITENLDIYLSSNKSEYSVTFVNDDNSTVLQKSFVKEGESVIFAGETPISTVDSNKIFTGWSDETTNITSNKTVVAQYSSASNLYSITYNLLDGSFGETAVRYFDGSKVVSLPTKVVKENYIFDGWYENAQYSGTKVTSIASGTKQNKTFYAKWSEVVANVINASKEKTSYSLVQSAIDSAKTDETIEVVNNSSENLTISGKTLKVISGKTGISISNAITVSSNAQLTIGGSAKENDLTVNSIVVNSGSVLNILGGSFNSITCNGTGTIKNADLKYLEVSGNLNVTNSNINGQVKISAGSVEISECEITLTKLSGKTAYGFEILGSSTLTISNSSIENSTTSINNIIYSNSATATSTINSCDITQSANSSNYLFNSALAGTKLNINNTEINSGNSPVISDNFGLNVQNSSIKTTSTSVIVNLTGTNDVVNNSNISSESTTSDNLICIKGTASVTGGTFISKSSNYAVMVMNGAEVTMNSATIKTTSGNTIKNLGTITMQNLISQSTTSANISVEGNGIINLSNETSTLPTLILSGEKAKIVVTSVLSKRFEIDGTKSSGQTLVECANSVGPDSVIHNFTLVGSLSNNTIQKSSSTLILG